MLHLYDVFLENVDFDNCDEVVIEEYNKMFNVSPLHDKHHCNIITMYSMNIHDANNMQSHKLGDAMFDEDDLFSPPTFDEKINDDDNMPPIYDDYSDESGFRRMSTLGDPTILEGFESYNDKSGFGRVMTLFNDDSTILEEVSIGYYEKKFIYMMITVMTCML